VRDVAPPLKPGVAATDTANRRCRQIGRPQRRPGLKVLFTTGYTGNAIVHHGRVDHGVPFLMATVAEMRIPPITKGANRQPPRSR